MVEMVAFGTGTFISSISEAQKRLIHRDTGIAFSTCDDRFWAANVVREQQRLLDVTKLEFGMRDRFDRATLMKIFHGRHEPSSI